MAALTKISLVVLALAGGAALHGLSISTGFFALVDQYKAKGVLAQGIPYDPKLTGVDAVDDLLGTLVQFFWPVVDGSAPGLSLQSFYFTTQLIAFYMVFLLEGSRNGSKGKLISYVSIFGLLFQAVGLGFVAPLHLLLYVFTSPTVTSPTPSNLAIDPAILSGIPFAFSLGFFPITIFMSLPVPDVISVEARVKALAVWQPVPVYISALLGAWTLLSSSTSSATVSKQEQLRRLRNVYKFGLAFAVPVHGAAVGLSLAAVVFPQIYTQAIAAEFHPLAAFIPQNPLTYANTTISSLSQGTLCFLQWDMIITSSAYLVFSLSARFNARVAPKGFSAGDLVGVVVRISTMGPMAAALSYLWERDEIVLGTDEQKKLR